MSDIIKMKDPLYKFGKNIKAIEDSNGCYICVSHAKCSNGRYYNIKRNNKIMLLHRYVYESYHEEIPNGLIVRHKCDNVLCINPNHLVLGSHQDNSNDKVERNRQAKFERNGASKLSNNDVLNIRKLYKDGVMQRNIANMYDVTDSTISMIVNDIIWKDLN